MLAVDDTVTPSATAACDEGEESRERPRACLRVREWPPHLRRTLMVCGVVLLAQLAIFAVWSQVEASRFVLNIDAAQYEQAWYLMAHGVLNPVDSMKAAYFWQDHSVFLFWSVTPLWYLWPHPVTLLWLQDLAAVLAQWIGLLWMGEAIAAPHRIEVTKSRQVALLACGAVLFVADPWITWSISNDFHVEVFSVLFVMSAARDFKNDRRRGWLWVVLAMATGNLAATYLIGLGISAWLAGRAWRRRALIAAAMGLGWAEFCSLIHGDLGSAFIGYHYLLPASSAVGQGSLTSVALGALKHPGAAWSTIWGYKLSIWADLSSGGLVGIMSPWVVGVPLVVLAENALNDVPNYISANTGYQNFPEFIFVPIGTVVVCLALARAARPWCRRVALPLALSSALLVVGWGVVWFPQTLNQWLRVPAASAQVLAQVESQISPAAEVIASQGIFADLSWHRWVYNLTNVPLTIPFAVDDVWFVVTPNLGIEVQSPSSAMAFISQAAALPGATLVVDTQGVWAIHWHRVDPYTHIVVHQDVAAMPAYAAVGGSGTSFVEGPSAQWHVSATPAQGYVVSQDYFSETTTGYYSAEVNLDARGPVSVEVWDTSTNTLLERASQVVTRGRQTATLSFAVTSLHATEPFQGRWLWQSPPPPAPYGVTLEIRVWTPGSTVVSVYSLGITKDQGPRAPLVVH